MKCDYIFRLWVDGNAVFESGGRYFVNYLLDESHVAVGLFTDDSVGFVPVDDMSLYAAIQMLIQENARLEVVRIVGRRQKYMIVAIQFEGEYEYFALQDIMPEQVTDALAGELACAVEPGRVSSFECPYVVTFKDSRIWAVK